MTPTTIEPPLDDLLEQGIVQAALEWHAADIYVHPYLSRADSVQEAEQKLIRASERYLSVQLPKQQASNG